MRYTNIFQLSFTAAFVQWSLASEIPDHVLLDRTLQDTIEQDGYDTCLYVCEDNDEHPSIPVQVTIAEAENQGFFGRIMNRLDGTFHSGSRFGRLMNGLFNFFRPLQQQNKPKYKISTDLLVSTLSRASVKAKALAAMIRSDSESFAAESAAPNVVTTLLEWSAESMESVALVIDPIVDDMSQYETMDLATVSCAMGQLLTQIGNATIPNIVSVAEIIYTKSGNATMERLYKNYVAEKKTTPLVDARAAVVDATNQCVDDSNSAVLNDQSFIPTQMVIAANGSLGISRPLQLRMLEQTIIFPLSLLSSMTTVIFAIFMNVSSVIVKNFIISQQGPPSNNDDFRYDDDCTAFACGSDFTKFLIISILTWLIFAPILLPILLPVAIIQFLFRLIQMLLSPILSPGEVSKPINEVLYYVMLVVESPMENMLVSLKHIYNNDGQEEAALELDCDVQTILCQYDVLMASLPF
jgi:hypothetical protein